ncbi:MAG: exonuclease SbcCD subunit D [Thermomicrobiales bacterium]|nr:exonuclease SbcCD subunit D [Thermomicrobiales bacterium]
MPALRFAHISDTHLGYRTLFKADPVSGRNQRAVDIERAYETAINDILTRDVQLVIHGGDVFHHTRPAWSSLRCFVRQTRRLSDAGIPVVVIGGNHDTPRLRTSGSVFSVLELALPDIRFVCGYEQETVILDDPAVSILAVPHGKLASPTSPIAIPTPGMRNILVTHGLVHGLALKGAQHREPGEEDVADSLLDEEFDYIALGHYHVHQKVRHNAWYSGSTERMGFGDEDVTPGYAIVELNDSASGADVTHIPIEARPMKTLAPLDGESRSAREIADIVLERLEKFVDPETIARVELRNTPRPIKREADAILRRESPQFCWALQVFAKAEILLPTGEVRPVSESTDVRSLFDEFVASRAYEPAFASAFSERGRRALNDATHALESVAPEDGSA